MIKTWEYKEIYDVKRCIYTYLKLKDGFYGHDAFYLIEDIPSDNADQFVVYPNITEKLQGHKLKELSEMNKEYINSSLFDDSTNLSQSLISSILDTTIQYPSFDTTKLVKLKKEWTLVEKAFVKELHSIFPSMDIEKNEYRAIFTRFGTIGSYLDPKQFTYLILREDATVATIAELILASAFRQNTKYLFNTKSLAKVEQTMFWYLIEGVTDVLMQTSPLKTLFPKFNPTLNAVLNTTDLYPKYRKDSDEYLEILGFKKSKELEIKNNIFINSNSNRPIKNLNYKEEEILRVLITNENKLVSYEDIAQILWGDDYLDSFSLNAINKAIHSIRTKLTMQKIIRSKIKTNRGLGYTFVQ